MTSFQKETQLFKNQKIHRNPEKLRQLLRKHIPSSKEESEAERYGKCANPKCVNIGTIDRPLDLHHIIPRSQSKSLINNYTNHLYLCGDRFVENHHKALHGEATPGLTDWKTLGIFGDWHAEDACQPHERVDGAAARLLELSTIDRICKALITQNPHFAYDYAIKKGIFPKQSGLYPEDIDYITEYIKNIS